MREFLYRLASRFDAPALVRSWLMPNSGMTLVSGHASDPVAEFYKELGIKSNHSAGILGWIKRVILTSHEWTRSNVSSPLATLLTASYTFMFSIVLSALNFADGMWVPFVFSGVLGIFLAFAFSQLFDGNGNTSDERGRSSFQYFFLFEMAGLYAYSFFHSLPLAWVPMALYTSIWLGNGILNCNKYKRLNQKKKSEVLVSEALDQFIAKNHPDIMSKESLLNKKLSALAENISRAKIILDKLRGEYQADIMRSGGRADAIDESMDQISSRLDKLEKEEKILKENRTELVVALQMFDSLKDDAVTYVRLRDLSKEADEVLGDATALSIQTGREIETIRERFRDGLERINRAVAKLGLNTLALEEGVSMKALSARAESIGEKVVENEKVIYKLTLVKP